MKGKRSWVLLVLVLSLTSGHSATRRRASAGPPDAERAALLQVDREFDRATAERGVEAWVSYFSENGSMVSRKGPPVTGHDAIRQLMTPVFGNPDFSLRWQPTRAEILIPHDLGYTVGRYERRAKNQEGKRIVQRGTYVTLWRKQADGSWKIILDTGSEGDPPIVVD